MSCNNPELEISKKQNEQDKKAIDELIRERDILNKVRYCEIYLSRLNHVVLEHRWLLNCGCYISLLEPHYIGVLLCFVQTSASQNISKFIVLVLF